ncbi:hypothetical protein [uncultured Modestobacter sp.]|uniref:hypothetical protein n=1 Tax=uncultured Modestobacter sp. TaxID=380048 RepID=UPI0026100371|nr:hypothetical protein [uncultured Modestobacter sp.]
MKISGATGLLGLASVSLVLAACTGTAQRGEVEAGASGSSVAAALPGDEALTPPPPDPAAQDLRAQFADLVAGQLAAALDLQLSGLAAFAEQVVGDCSPDEATLTATLSDGSEVELRFTEDQGELVVRAPGIVVEQTLTDVDLAVEGRTFRLDAGLLTAGTSEESGHLGLEGTCG